MSLSRDKPPTHRTHETYLTIQINKNKYVGRWPTKHEFPKSKQKLDWMIGQQSVYKRVLEKIMRSCNAENLGSAPIGLCTLEG